MYQFKHIDPEVIHLAAASGVHVYPYAEWRPLPENATQRNITPSGLMYHTMAGSRSTTPDALWKWMARGDVTGECHTSLGYSTMIQQVAFNVRADNNYKANGWTAPDGIYRGYVSVETQDDGSTYNVEDDPWNEYQLEQLAGLTAFLHLHPKYDVPLRRYAELPPDPTDPGDGLWKLGCCDGHRAEEDWSIYQGKTCPGQKRWEQIPFIIALAQQIVAWQPIEEDLMNAILWRHHKFADVFLLGVGSPIHVSAGVRDHYKARGVPMIVDDTAGVDDMLIDICSAAGLRIDSLTKL